MRRIIVSAFTLSLLSVPALAVDANKISCKAYAQAVADEWSSGDLMRAEAGDPIGDGDQVLVIAAGRSYYVPSKQNRIILKSAGTAIREHKKIYWQEFRRCMRGGHITINLGSSTETN